MSEASPLLRPGDELVTGEGVALDLPAAGIGMRVLSGLLDIACTLVLLLVVVTVLSVATFDADGALQHVGLIATLIVVFLAVPTAVETLTRGKSVGKLATGLRTVRDDGGPISAQHAFVRSLVGFVEIYALSGAPAFFAVLLSDRGKRLGDLAAGTYVVRERVRLTLPPPAPMPPPLASWARSADIAPLPAGLGLAVRQLLARAPGLDPATRHELALRLAREVAERVQPPPPRDTPPEAFLAAVLAERRERDLVRLRRERDRVERLSRRA